MLLSKSGEYALQALLHLASDPGRRMPTNQIAEALDAPSNYLSKLLHRLARGGVLRSVRGPQGGFELTLPAEQLSLAEALAPIEAERLDRRCLLGRPQCSDRNPCAAHGQWRSLAEHIDRFLAETTIADVLGTDRERASRKRPRRQR
jgi:Rrf2 family protein